MSHLEETHPIPTAGSLPSSRTEDMLQEALDHEDPNHKDAQLKHLWSHYQSLEFALNAHKMNVTAMTRIAEDEGLTSVEDLLDMASRFYTTSVLYQAYELAHETGLYVAILGKTVPEALRGIYAGAELDFTDPAAEAQEAASAPVIETDK